MIVMRIHVVPIALLILTGCQAPEETAQIQLASDDAGELDAGGDETDPLADFVSDDPCGWDDPLAYHRYDEDGAPWTSTGFSYYDDQDDTVMDWGRFYVAVHADGKASLRYYAIDQTESFYQDIDWERDPEHCVVRLYADDGTMLLALGNPVPAEEIDVENNVDGFHSAEIVDTEFSDLATHEIIGTQKRGGI
jgi:hypothetical protein